ncbi:MAG: Quercetin 2,3-dioxygenase [Candidatus Heimdallarchaeota archaeon LC_3]|nr:MAG: Quercetin 2,3-dioxygenase [Candidatus Heimdallarchaeota archaeon LC_3]
MTQKRKIKLVLESKPTSDGAGVKLRRAFGNAEVPLLDPFLLLDNFGTDNPDDYMAGFPMHPHRGIETITYMLHGKVEHEDSLKNKGVIESGDLQWMSAGSGIIHQEMPQLSSDKRMAGFQLWANLPRVQKMSKPKYRDITKDDVPVIETKDKVKIKVVGGEFEGEKGPVKDVAIKPTYYHITMPKNTSITIPFEIDHTVFAYAFQGSGYFDAERSELVNTNDLVLYENGEIVTIQSGSEGLEYLLISGKPLNEPVAWYGPIVMNTREELVIAFEEYQKNEFIKHEV